jgi:hypothetical protein
MRHPHLFLAGLVGVTAAAGSLQSARAEAPASDRPPVHTLRLSEKQVLARFIPVVRARTDLRERAVALWRAHFEAEADAIRLRFLQEPDWRPAFADAAALVDDYLEASLLPRTGEFPAGEEEVWVESIDPRSGQRVRARQPKPRRPLLLAPAKSAERKQAEADADDKPRGVTKPAPTRGRTPVRRR